MPFKTLKHQVFALCIVVYTTNSAFRRVSCFALFCFSRNKVCNIERINATQDTILSVTRTCAFMLVLKLANNCPHALSPIAREPRHRTRHRTRSTTAFQNLVFLAFIYVIQCLLIPQAACLTNTELQFAQTR